MDKIKWSEEITDEVLECIAEKKTLLKFCVEKPIGMDSRDSKKKLASS